MEIIVPHLLAILLQGVYIRFKAILLQGVALAMLLQVFLVWSLLTVKTCFIIGQVFQKQPSWVWGNTWFCTCVYAKQEKELEDKQESGVVDKEILVLFVIDTHCEIKNVNNQC